jgi:hypothetical protein
MSRTDLEKIGFSGAIFTLTDNWLPVIPLPTSPIKYLEIGAFHGANVCSIVKTYAAVAGSEVHCVDPWKDYDAYPEYKGQQNQVYSIFLHNICKLSDEELNKLYIHRSFSADIIPTFPDNYFDIIYIDGNHEAPYVLEDAILSFKKLKVGGHLIFDDFTWDGVQAGLNSFMNTHKDYFENATCVPGVQCIMKKIGPKN